MSAPTTELLPPEKKPTTLREFLETRRDALAGLIPAHMDAQVLINLAVACVTRDAKLRACSPASILMCVIQAAEVGLRPGVAGQAWLIPRWNHKTGATECTFQVGVAGLITLMLRSPRVSNVRSVLVREGDEFEYREGTSPEIIHKPVPFSDAPVIGAYAVIHLADGTAQVEPPLSIREIERIRDAHAPRNREGKIVGPWVTDPEEMMRKVPLRRAYKYAPKEVEDLAAAALAMEDSGQPRLRSGEPVPLLERVLDPEVLPEAAADVAKPGIEGQGARLASMMQQGGPEPPEPDPGMVQALGLEPGESLDRTTGEITKVKGGAAPMAEDLPFGPEPPHPADA